MPAQAGIQSSQEFKQKPMTQGVLGPRLRGDDTRAPYAALDAAGIASTA
jgi:hypothetical protein